GLVDALSVAADCHPRRVTDPMAVDAGTRPGLADAAGGAGGLADRPRGRVAVEARDGVLANRGDVDALSVRAHRHGPRGIEPMAVGARTRPRLADAAG